MSSNNGLQVQYEPNEMGSIRINQQLKQFYKNICTKETLKKKFPISKWLPKYSLSDLQCDVISGLTVGLTVIPQGLAYAKIAGLPPQYGLYSSFMGCFVYCFLGTSKDITLGPTAIMSLMTGTFAISPIPNDATYAIILTLMCGVVQLVMGLLNLGILVNFISYPVINAFTSAAAITIAFGQVKHIFGLKNIPRDFLPMVYDTFANLGQTKVWDMVLGFASLVALYLIKKLRSIKWQDEDEPKSTSQKVARKFLWLFGTGANAVVVISAAGIAASLISMNIKDKITITGHLKQGLPPLQVPAFSIHTRNITQSTGEIFSKIGAGFFIVPLLGLVETIAIGKAFARQNSYKIDPTQELIAIGVANIISCFISSYPVTGSFSRTAVNSQSGVRSPASGIVTGALILLALQVLTPLFYYVPQAALGAVIISAVLQMIDWKILKILWNVDKIDLVPLIITFISSLVIGIEYGIMVGIGLSLLMLLYPLARPKLKYINQGNILVVQPNQGMNFPSAEFISETIVQKATEGGSNRSVIFDCCHIYNIDYSAILGLKELVIDLEKNKLQVALCHVQPTVLEVIERAEIQNLSTYTTLDIALQELPVYNVQGSRQCEEDESKPLLRKF
ncbi:hypothetical protein LOTGIDRAFT_212898 [Lottia gigantea]|uniref:STAS domain-containing protein n=1 Tax=Lottia gigantea TaxID=225164 RepID=V4CH35_LOTGI|nr:hypothetical protein LOTGIDRAFT_212898 [Lottia gigantea]ESP01400.1 hypothetical protein LOTGIDRAFT_212898 [Lottia gigantea]